MLRSGDPVLVVEDHQATRDAIERLLDFHGYPVFTTCDGQEALEYLEAGGRASAIVIDVGMPRMDAHMFRERQLANPDLAHIPVIVFTGAPLDPVPGAVGCVPKTDPDGLLALLGHSLSARRVARA